MKYIIKNKKTKKVYERESPFFRDAFTADLSNHSHRKAKDELLKDVAENGIESFSVEVDGGYVTLGKVAMLSNDHVIVTDPEDKVSDEIVINQPDELLTDEDFKKGLESVGFKGKANEVQEKDKKKKK